MGHYEQQQGCRKKDTVVNALTIDVEDWFHGFEPYTPGDGPEPEPRLEFGVSRILDMLEAHGVRATFFVLGELVQQWRSLLRRVAGAGHEIASHGYRHKPIYCLSPAEFARDLHRSIEVLRPVTGEQVRSYRAPYFSITMQSLWALPILKEAGITRDSSVVPAHNPRYGIPGAERFPHPACPGLFEYPISTIGAGNVRLPFGGGFYARLLPYRVIKRAVARLNSMGQPAVFYFHPWELDPDHPRITDDVPALYRFTHYYALRGTAPKLEALLRDFAFGPLAAL